MKAHQVRISCRASGPEAVEDLGGRLAKNVGVVETLRENCEPDVEPDRRRDEEHTCSGTDCHSGTLNAHRMVRLGASGAHRCADAVLHPHHQPSSGACPIVFGDMGRSGVGEIDRAQVRLAELVGALSLGIDLGFGQPMEHVLRQCLIALAAGRGRAARRRAARRRRLHGPGSPRATWAPPTSWAPLAPGSLSLVLGGRMIAEPDPAGPERQRNARQRHRPV